MIALWTMSLVLLAASVVVFYFAGAQPLWLRLVLALCIWPLPPLLLTLWVVAVGDRAPSDAITISTPEAKQ